jgi:two-component system KDP operon response regulator KdpE
LPREKEVASLNVLVIAESPDVVEIIGLCFHMRWPDATVLSTGSGREAVGRVETDAPDIVILDLALRDVQGVQVLKEIRRFSDLPLIVVSGDSNETTKITALEMGADDYLTKPFSPTELMARAKAVLRRTHMPELRDDSGIVRTDGVSIDMYRRRMLIDEHEISLTPTEWRLLTYLARNEGRVISHRVLAEKVWHSEYTTGSAIKMCVRRLRHKIGDAGYGSPMIRTHRGMGYSFAPVS